MERIVWLSSGGVENVSAAIVLAALHPAAAGWVYNVGATYTPRMAERLANMPPSSSPLTADAAANFEQNIAYDTSRIREELDNRESVPETEGLRRTLAAASGRKDS